MRSVPSRRSDASHARRMYPADTSEPVVRRVPSSNVLPNFVAMTTASRSPASARPTTVSLWPVPYTSAVSKKVTPSSSPRRMAATDTSSSTSPQPDDAPSRPNGPPMAQHPKPRALTVMSERASVRCMPRA